MADRVKNMATHGIWIGKNTWKQVKHIHTGRYFEHFTRILGPYEGNEVAGFFVFSQ